VNSLSLSFSTTALAHHDDEDTDEEEEEHNNTSSNIYVDKHILPLPHRPNISNGNTMTSVNLRHIDDQQHEFTFSRAKAGSPSPWAVFDAWGAGTLLEDDLAVSKADEAKLTHDAVRIPVTSSNTGNNYGVIASDNVRVGFNRDGTLHTSAASASAPASATYNETEILEAYDKFLQQRSVVHFGYPYNLMYDHSELYQFMKYSINNLGDPFVPSNYGIHSRQFECAVIDFFAQLWNMPPESYWGYVTTSGTEGNLHGILLARECHPDAILYTSNETHYSVFKAARYYRMDLNSIPTLAMGEINYDLLAQELDRNRHVPAIINVNIGTTVKGAVDDIDRIIQILQDLGIPRERYHIHCDGALFALMMPFIDDAPKIDFQTKPIDSIAVSGHKMLGCPMPCGVAVCRKEHVQKVEQHIDYLNSVDTTIMGSRNGQAALYMWYSLRKKGLDGIQRDVVHCMNTARYLRDKLLEASFTCRLNDLSSTVVLERPVDDKFVKRWQLACEDDIAHVVVMPNVTRQKIDQFVNELCQSAQQHGRIEPKHPKSSLVTLMSSAWDQSSR
jgi:histidine decarboxylase